MEIVEVFTGVVFTMAVVCEFCGQYGADTDVQTATDHQYVHEGCAAPFMQANGFEEGEL